MNQLFLPHIKTVLILKATYAADFSLRKYRWAGWGIFGEEQSPKKSEENFLSIASFERDDNLEIFKAPTTPEEEQLLLSIRIQIVLSESRLDAEVIRLDAELPKL